MPLGHFRLLTIFTILFASIAALSADMPPISDEDQKLTAVPGVPGAPAAVLFREEIFDDIRHSARIQARIKILTDEGRKYADVSIPYDRKNLDLAAISGRTIHPDGKIISFEGKPFDKTMFRGKDIRYNVKTFHSPRRPDRQHHRVQIHAHLSRPQSLSSALGRAGHSLAKAGALPLLHVSQGS